MAAPQLKRLPENNYDLIINSTLEQIVRGYLSNFPSVYLKTYKDIPTEFPALKEELNSRIEDKTMQYLYAAWGDFNKDGVSDVAFLFLGNEVYQVVVFHGNSAGAYTPFLIVNDAGRPHGMY